MNLREKLQIIQNISSLTQTALAARLEVSFATFNSWWTGKSQPRPKKLELIDGLYRELSGQKLIPDDVLVAKKMLVAKEAKKYPDILKLISDNPDIYDQFLLSLTYHSNKIEGSTLSEDETADILFNNQALSNKSLIEHLEVKNHQAALNYLFTYLKSKVRISEELILKLHSILLNGIRDDAGCFRQHAVRIVGSYVPTANYLKVPELIKALVKDINEADKDIIATTSRIHAEFEKVHPFADGNGRIGRLIMAAQLVRANLPPAVIEQGVKRRYYSSLNRAQLKGEYPPLEDFICEAVLKGCKIVDRK
ncbi:MAG: Fic family protein [Patescibacteria group bacterium]